MWTIWRPIFGWENLCPVITSVLSGFIVIMRRADQPVSFIDIEQADCDYYPDIEVEYKPENWGKVGGKVVCLDYGIEEMDLVNERRAYLESKRNGFGIT